MGVRIGDGLFKREQAYARFRRSGADLVRMNEPISAVPMLSLRRANCPL